MQIINQKKLLTFVLILLCIVSIPSGSLSAADHQELSPGEIALKLQESYDRIQILSADFRQLTIINMSGRMRQGAGSVVFQKPGRMRWDYIKPARQVIISDGASISMYFEKEKQIIITSAKEYLQSDVTYSFFAGTGNILQDFNVSPPDQEASDPTGDHLIKLVPKTMHPQIDHLYVWVGRRNFLINRLQIIDYFDTVTDIFFENIQTDNSPSSPDIASDFFTFTPPPGTEVIRQ